MGYKYPGIFLYAYCAGNPVNAVDPEGTDEWNINKNREIVEHIENTEHIWLMTMALV